MKTTKLSFLLTEETSVLLATGDCLYFLFTGEVRLPSNMQSNYDIINLPLNVIY